MIEDPLRIRWVTGKPENLSEIKALLSEAVSNFPYHMDPFGYYDTESETMDIEWKNEGLLTITKNEGIGVVRVLGKNFHKYNYFDPSEVDKALAHVREIYEDFEDPEDGSEASEVCVIPLYSVLTPEQTERIRQPRFAIASTAGGTKCRLDVAFAIGMPEDSLKPPQDAPDPALK